MKKKINNALFVIRLLFVVLALFFSALLSAQPHEECDPVKHLQHLLKENTDFRQTLELTLANLQDLPDGSPNPWQGKNENDLMEFLNDWFYFLPHTQNGLDKIMHFSWLYYKNPHGLKFVKEEPGLSWTKYFVQERGKYMDSQASTSGIAAWLENTDLHNDEFVLPAEGYGSFNEFFTRNLKPGARPVSRIDDNAVIVSPADGLLNIINNEIKADDKIPLKGNMQLNIRQVLGNSKYSEKFIGGTALACFLLPDNYHHYHAPVTGTLVESNQNVGKYLFGLEDLPGLVNEGNAGYNQDFSVFEDFKHGYFIFQTKGFGYVAMVPVGLQTIGSVVFEEPFQRIEDGDRLVHKGEKLGHFAYGGSLVMLFFEEGRFDAIKTLQGQQIGKLNK